MHLTPPPPPPLSFPFTILCSLLPTPFPSPPFFHYVASPIDSFLSSPPFFHYVASPILSFLSSSPFLYYVSLLQSFPFFPLRLSFTTLLLQSFPSTFCITFTTPSPLLFPVDTSSIQSVFAPISFFFFCFTITLIFSPCYL